MLLLSILVAAVTSTAPGDKALTFSPAYSLPALDAGSILMTNGVDALSAESAAVIYSAIEGYAERAFTRAMYDSGCDDFKTNDIPGVAFGSAASRTFEANQPAIWISQNDYNSMLSAIRIAATVQNADATNDWAFSSNDFYWCLPTATTIPNSDWAAVGISAQIPGTTWTGVCEIPFARMGEPGYTPGEVKFALTRINDWLCQLNVVNYQVSPFTTASQSSLASQLDSLVYMLGTLYGSDCPICPTNVQMSSVLTPSHRSDWRLAIPLFDRAIVSTDFGCGIKHSFLEYHNEVSAVAIVKDFPLPFREEKAPSFSDADWKFSATNYINRYTTDVYSATGDAALVLGNGAGGPSYALTCAADLIAHADLTRSTFLMLGHNALCIDPTTFDTASSLSPFQIGDFDEEKMVFSPSGMEADIFSYVSHSNEVAELSAKVSRTVRMKIPEVVKTGTSLFPAAGIRRLSAPSVNVQHMALLQSIGYAGDELENDPMPNAGVFSVSTSTTWRAHVNAMMRSSSGLTISASPSNITESVMAQYRSNVNSLFSEFSREREGSALETLIPIEPSDLTRTISAARSDIEGKTISSGRQTTAGRLVLIVEELDVEEMDIKDHEVKKAYVCRNEQNNEWESVPFGENGKKPSVVIGSDIFLDGLRWREEENRPEFSWEGQPRWWHGCVKSLTSLFVKWGFRHYKISE